MINKPQQLKPEVFLDRIKEDVERGQSFVPLVGSGISADSGILTGEQFTDYLADTLFRCVGLDGENRWDLRARGWPENKANVEAAKNWIAKEFAALARKAGLQPKAIKELIHSKYLPENFLKTKPTVKDDHFFPPLESLKRNLISFRCPLVPEVIATDSGYKYNTTILNLGQELNIIENLRDNRDLRIKARAFTKSVKEAAIRSLYDWRATLLFLASLKGEPGGRLILDQIEPHIIDAFNVHITKDRQPNFAHRMLAHLARPLGIRLILTTNFDKLIEQSFRDINHPLQSLPVTKIDGLPHPRTVRAQDSIIKLHGEITGTRADFSLDEIPSTEDIERFKQYICQDGVSRNLIVCGLSARDNRIVEMLRASLEIKNIKIYWICFSQRDEDRIKIHFDEHCKSNVFYMVSRRLDLVLNELYQKTTLSLPPGGFSYTFTHKRPPCPFSEKNIDQPVAVISKAKKWANHLVNPKKKKWRDSNKGNAFLKYHKDGY